MVGPLKYATQPGYILLLAMDGSGKAQKTSETVGTHPRLSLLVAVVRKEQNKVR